MATSQTTTAAHEAQQQRAKRELGSLYDRLLAICPNAGHFSVDREHGSLSFVPNVAVFPVSLTDIAKISAEVNGDATIGHIRVAPGDKGWRLHLAFSDVRGFPPL